MRRAVELARRFAPLDLPVLLVGETGTGKEVLAQAIHRWSGMKGELVDVDCGALAPGMVANELFGHRRGAYTSATESAPGLMERATHGTLFLDELSSLALEGQAALLRTLETGEVRRVGDLAKVRVQVRVIAALQDDIPRQLAQGRLRQDLYQRLAGGVIQLLPLRARREDLWPLARRFAELAGRTLASSARQVLGRHAWPGNVRELRHVLVRAACLSNTPELGAGVVAEAIDLGAAPGAIPVPLPDSGEEVRRSARARLEVLCREHGGDAEAIAGALRVSRSTLYRRLQSVGLRLNEMLRT
jgi:DNA-binding NtrC family response regulator